MKLLCCRHGETQWNKLGKLQGHLDSELSPLGVQQARALGIELSRYKPALIMTSDLGRAKETAVLVNERLNLSIRSSPLLRERGFGKLQGLLRHESQALWNAYEQRFNGDKMMIEDSESAMEVLDRGCHFLAELSSFDVETVIVICHGEWLRIMQNASKGAVIWSKGDFLAENCQIVELNSSHFI